MIKRHSEQVLERYYNSFPTVLITGARQTGKSTLLKNSNISSSFEYITFDDPYMVLSVKNDAKTFLELHESPVIFDEIQYVKKIFPFIKIRVDENRRNGMYLLTGSQQFELMKDVSESLAGRIGIITLAGISLRERFNETYYQPFIPTKEFIFFRRKSKVNLKQTELWRIIQEGSYPEIVTKNILPEDFYTSYIKTYIERDVRQLTQIADEMQFLTFISVVAARTGQLVNYKDLSRETGISEVTAKKWLSILVTSGIVYLLQPYSKNIEKRIVKTPKLYFFDTGLAAHLTKWRTPEVLMNGAMAGHFFETFVISEILKSFYNSGIEPPLYFYRDKDKIEVDLLIENDGTLYPVEIKKTASPTKSDIKSFSILKRIQNTQIGTGCVVCPCDDVGIISENVFSLPISCI